MSTTRLYDVDALADILDEKCEDFESDDGVSDVGGCNPVVESAEFIYKETNIVKLNEEGIKQAAEYVLSQLTALTYSPSTWRTHPLHLLPPEPYDPTDTRTVATLNWIFLISALNFSFWSEREGQDDRYGVEWREGWNADAETRKVHTGYWSLVAALNRAIEDGIPITDPTFYSSEAHCPDMVIANVFRRAPQSAETVPLLKERIAVMREVGHILCSEFGGSFSGFLQEFQRRHNNKGTTIQLVHMVTETFPAFRDEFWFKGRQVYFWKRAQILVAETWAAFYPSRSTFSPTSTLELSSTQPTPHPLFPEGAQIHNLTMFADYRVPQILHHLRILTYPPSLVSTLTAHEYLASGTREELSIRAGSILAVERIRDEICAMAKRGKGDESRVDGAGVDVEAHSEVSSVLIDFYLWDLAKRVERGEQVIEGVETQAMVPAHRTRSIWY